MTLCEFRALEMGVGLSHLGGSQRKAADRPHQTDSNEVVQRLTEVPRGWLLGEVSPITVRSL